MHRIPRLRVELGHQPDESSDVGWHGLAHTVLVANRSLSTPPHGAGKLPAWADA
jgi:hypothetical protein